MAATTDRNSLKLSLCIETLFTNCYISQRDAYLEDKVAGSNKDGFRLYQVRIPCGWTGVWQSVFSDLNTKNLGLRTCYANLNYKLIGRVADDKFVILAVTMVYG